MLIMEEKNKGKDKPKVDVKRLKAEKEKTIHSPETVKK